MLRELNELAQKTINMNEVQSGGGNSSIRPKPSPIDYGIAPNKLQLLDKKDRGTTDFELKTWLIIIAVIFYAKIRSEIQSGSVAGDIVGNVIMFAILPGLFIYIGVFIVIGMSVTFFRKMLPSWNSYYKYKTDYEQWCEEEKRHLLLQREIKEQEARRERELQHQREIVEENNAIKLALTKLNSKDKPALEELKKAFLSKQWSSAYYRAYLKTEHWKETRKMALARAGHRCQVCGKKYGLQVHHNSYERLGYESPEDLAVLCESHHSMFHEETRRRNRIR